MATTTNTGTILVGVTLDGGDSLINTATGSVTGPGIAVLGLGGTTAATVDNFGIILGASQPVVELLSGGVVLNRAAATISAAGAVGVTISGGKGTVRNAGTIAGATSAVLLAAGYANRVIVDPGAAFTGTVQGGNTLFNNTLNSTLISTLELASGATTGTLTGLNSQFVNFQSVTIDAGGSWVMDATNTGTANQNVAAFGTLTNLASFNHTIVASNNGVVSNSTTGTILGVVTGGVGSTHATVVNAGLLGSTLSRGVRLGTGATLTNLSSGTIVGRVAAYSAFDDSRNAVDVGTNAVAINAGSIVGSYGTRGHGISFLGSGATVTNQSGGTITGLDAVFAYNLSGANTLINAGRINVNATSAAHGVRFSAGGTVINQAGGIILGYTAIDIRNGTAPRVINAGSIGGIGQAIFMYGGSSVTNQAGGTITSSGQGPSGTVTDAAIAFFGNAAVTNAGSIGANSTIGTGISGSGGSVTNQSGGAITGKYAIYLSGNGTVTNAGSIGGNSATGIGVQINQQGLVINQSTGTIRAATGVQFNIVGYNATLRNAGLIVGDTGTAVKFGSYAVDNRLILDPGAAFTGIVDGGPTLGNTDGYISTLELASGASAGTLSGFGTQFINFANITVDSNASWTLASSNTIGTGYAIVDAGSLTNAGTLGTAVTLGSGALLTNASTGVIDVSGTAVVASAGAVAVVNAGTIAGSSTSGVGIYLAAGGTVTNQGSGTITGVADAVLFKAGFTNRLVVAPGAVFSGTVSGGNTIGATAISTLELASGASAGTLSGLGTQFVNFAAVTVDAGAAWVLASGNSLATSQTLLVDGTLTNQASLSQSITLGQNGLLTNSATGTLVTAVGYHGAGAPHQTIVNAGVLGNTEVLGVNLDSGGTLTNLSTGTIVGRVGGVMEVRDSRYAVAMGTDGVVVNAGTILGGSRVFGVGVLLGGGGTLTNQSGGSISGHDGIMGTVGAATVVNAGTLDGLQAAVDMYAGGLVTNQTGGVVLGNNSILFRTIAGTIVNDGLISAPHVGIELRAGGSVTNQTAGTIVSTGYGYYGGNGTAILARGASTVVNKGSIGAYLVDGTGIDLDIGSITNQANATITGKTGVKLGAATLVNAGLIEGAALSTGRAVSFRDLTSVTKGTVTVINQVTGTLQAATGFYVRGGHATLSNAGSIIGSTGTAVRFAAGYTNRVIFRPGAVFGGTVSGGNTIGSTVVSTLELASGASVGTLSGLGTQFVNFAAVTVDVGASWLLASGNSLATSQTLLVDGTLTNQASLSQSITLGQNGLLTNSATGTLVTAVGYHGSGATHQTVVNAGRLGNTNVLGVHLDSGGTLTNLSSGTIVGRVGGVQEVRDSRYAVVMGSGGVVVNAGRIIGGSRVFGVGVLLDGGGTLTNQSSGSISGQDGIMARVGAATVVNAGTLNGQQAAIDMYAGGLVTNQTGGVVLGNNSILFRTIAGTIINDGLISAPQLGVDLRAGGSITNQASGTIVSTGVGYYGSNGIAIRTRGLSTVVNRGSISASLGDGTGIDLDTGLLTNQASATVVGYIGVKLGAATLVNAGLILGDAAYGRAVSFYDTTSVTKGTVTVTNQATGTLQAATGFYVYGGNATLANAGLIVGSAGTAAHFAAGYTNRLILTKGAVFTGLVDGGNTIGATAVSTLELGSGATEGTLSSLGTQFVNFAAITVAGGGIWSIDPASPVAANQSLLVGGTLVNRDTLTHAIMFSSGGVVSNTATGTISTGTISIFGATIGGDGTVLNAGLILGSAAAVGLLSGGGVSNASTGRIAGTSVGVYLTTSSTVANSGSVFNAGTIIGTTAQGIEIAAGGTVSNASTGLISGGYRGLSIGVPNTAQSVLVINRGSIVGGTGAGVSVGAGTITNVAGGTISGVTQGIDATGRLTLVDAGGIVATGSTSRAVDLHAGGFVSIQSGGRVTGGAVGIDIAGAEGTVTNAGSIVGTSTGATGIRLQAGGSISNAASGDIIAAFGVYISSVAATVSNSGTIRGTANNGVAFSVGGSVTNAASGTIVGHYSAVNFHTAAASVSNAGTLTSTDASGVNGNVGGMITNLSGGTIQGKDYGVLLSGAAGTVSNAGIVIGTNNRGVYLSAGGVVTNASAGTIFGYGGVAIDGAAGTVVNLGSIGASGANAVRLAAGFSDRLVVSPGAAFTGKVDGGNTIGATAASTLELTSGASAGTISGFGGQFVNFANTTIDAGASWTLTGTNTLALGATLTNAGTLTLLNASLTDAGALVNNGGIILDPSTLVVSGLTGNGSVTIAAGSTLEVTGTVSSGETIVFGGLGAFLKIDSPAAFAGRIVNFDAGQTIDLVGIAPATVGYTSGSGVLNFGTSGGTIALSSLAPASLNVGASSDGAGLTSTLCFRANTMLLTPSGERSVRDLRVGDAVTVWGGGTRPIMWIGEGKVLATRGRRGPATPAIVRKGALGDNVPARDLHVTKGHALYVDDVLIPVEFLVNHRSIVWDDHAQEVELYHIELDRHDVLIANGAPAESYRDDGNRWLFQNANNGWDLPALEPFAPVLTGGPIVDAAWRRILERAGPRDNLTLTDDPDLHLRVDGKRINPLFGDGDRFMFRLRADADEIRLMSRAGVPSELGVARDARALGVAVRAIRLRTDTRIKTIGAADERLTDGFHAFEADNDIRWTNGDASLPIDRLGTARGTLLLEVVLGGRTRYLDTGYGSVAGSVPGRAAA